ncbi:MAG: 4-(cytidine 5'-diphospho)-2-C-methyl-D-erythritol kinase, partial [Ignavibacteriales bacterium]|nr:4-(cytidine 5'-diphospho)-2-C-methyl-D-erythritol kinase [Ignavibacteriales bacterium]
MKRIEIFSPAKINVGLFVVAKRADGFHDIETVFYPIGLRDKMSFDPADEFSFACDDPTIPTGADNLVVKAKDALERETGKRCDVAVRLEKRIPTGGGLGGGSSNAATTLVSLNELCGLGASRETVARLALELGSDVPFFLRPVPSFATGRGEKLDPLDFRIPFPILVVNPKIHVSTAEAYGACVPKKAS